MKRVFSQHFSIYNQPTTREPACAVLHSIKLKWKRKDYDLLMNVTNPNDDKSLKNATIVGVNHLKTASVNCCSKCNVMSRLLYGL